MNRITESIIGAAIEVHRDLGPGLLESAYETCLAFELVERGLKVEQQKPLPVVYRVFSQVCAYSPGKLEGLIEHYGLAKGKKVDVEKLMFAVHTYYTLVMKLFLTLLAVPGRFWCLR